MERKLNNGFNTMIYDVSLVVVLDQRIKSEFNIFMAHVKPASELE